MAGQADASPEPLRHVLGSAWSRRITEEDQLVYLVDGDDLRTSDSAAVCVVGRRNTLLCAMLALVQLQDRRRTGRFRVKTINEWWGGLTREKRTGAIVGLLVALILGTGPLSSSIIESIVGLLIAALAGVIAYVLTWRILGWHCRRK
jgi:hypothetical protein